MGEGRHGGSTIGSSAGIGDGKVAFPATQGRLVRGRPPLLPQPQLADGVGEAIAPHALFFQLLGGRRIGGEEEIERCTVTDLGVEHPSGGRRDGQGVAGLGGELLTDTLYGALEVGGHGHFHFISLHDTGMQGGGADTGDDNR